MLSGTKERVERYLALLVRCEDAVAEFYRVCAAAWPGEEAFWEGLADEETDHAVHLQMIQERVRRTPHGIGLLHAFPEAALQAFIDSVERHTALVRAGATTMSAALANARDLEQSLIGSQPLRGFSFDDPRFDGYRRKLTDEILRHGKRILERIGEGAPAYARTA